MKRTTTLILFVLIAFSKCEKLSEKENTKRLQECGNQTLTIPKGNHWPMEMDFPPDQWIVKVFLGESEGDSVKVWWEFTVGIFISPRHILTSSQPLITDDGRWYLDKENDINATCYLNETSHLIVPIEEMEDVDYSVFVTRNSSLKVKNKDLIRVKRGWILRARNQSDVGRMRSPMILELPKDVDGVQYPCLVQGSDDLTIGDQTVVYEFQEEAKPFERFKLGYSRRKIKGFVDRWILIERFYSDNSRGSPMIKDSNGKTTVIGISGSTGLSYREDDTVKQSYFFDMRVFNKDICELTGICDPPKLHGFSSTSPEPSRSTSSFSSSSDPSSTLTTSESSSSASPSLSSDDRSTTEPPESTPLSSSSDHLSTAPTSHPSDEPDRATEPSRRLHNPQPAENPEELEHDHDYIVSKDYLTGSGKMQLNLVLFFYFVVGLRYWI